MRLDVVLVSTFALVAHAAEPAGTSASEPVVPKGWTFPVARFTTSLWKGSIDFVYRLITPKQEALVEPGPDFEKRVCDLLGWSQFPILMIREECNVLPKQASAVDYDPIFIVETRDALFDEIQAFPPHADQPDPELGWIGYIESILERAQVSLPNYDELVEEMKTIRDSRDPVVAETLKQIQKDSVRPGYLASRSDLESLTRDCTEVALVYSLEVDPQLGYIQGMMDYCFTLKALDAFSNEDAFAGLYAMTKHVAQLSVGSEAPLADRTFILGQLYFHLFSEMHQLERPNIFDLIDFESVSNFELLTGHFLATGFHMFTISAGFRGNRYGALNPRPVIDFVLRHGRAGMIAIFLAGLEVNQPLMQQMLGKIDFPEAVFLIGDPFARGTTVTVEELITRAETYMHRTIGILTFEQAVHAIDALALAIGPQS